MNRTPIYYMAHPVGDGPSRAGNIRNAKLWFRLLAELVPQVGFSVPWLPYVETLDEALYRERGMRDDLEQLGRCDGIVAVGGRFSPGMTLEWGHAEIKRTAHNRALHRIDLTMLPGDPILMFQPSTIGADAPVGSYAYRIAITQAFDGV